MADLETALRTLTLQNAAVAAAIGTRFHWDFIPDNTPYPCVKAQTISDAAGDTHSGNWGGRALEQLDVYDDDKSGCNTTAALIRSWLHRYNGGMGAYNVTIKVRNVLGNWDEEERLFRRMLEVEILYMI